MFTRFLAAAARAAAMRCLPVLAAALGIAFLPAVAAARQGGAPILPPANPQYALGVERYNPPSCRAVTGFSAACLRESLAMINAGRRGEGLGPLLLPANWQMLTVAQQLYVLTELERSARGLAIDSGLSATLNGTAVTAAGSGEDPSGAGLAGLWAGGERNSIVVVAGWIYADGIFPDGLSENLDCTVAMPSGCWRHRDILLHDGAWSPCGRQCSVGAGYSPTGHGGGATGGDSYAEVFSGAAAGHRTFTWASELAQLPSCEQSGDTCSWAGRPVATSAGITTVGRSTRPAPVGAPTAATAQAPPASTLRSTSALRVTVR